ncbi:MAG: M14 family metallocarboxypeptidase [Verrucomicrobia bacterium]|nr:M14 family metallocarboxypeptidase [Verrucomicrobiota bacterium]
MREPAPVYLQRFARFADLQGFTRETALPAEAGIELWTRPPAEEDAPVIFLSGGIHGDEPCGPEALLRFVAEWKFSGAAEWILAPLLNPTGFEPGTRGNDAGIDLNRDFLRRACGETKALVDWWQRRPRPCHLHFSLHEDWEADGFYLYEIDTSGRGETLSPLILDSVSAVAPLQRNGPVDGHALAAPGMIVHDAVADEPEGWPEAIWLARTWPLQSYTFEAPGQLPEETRVESLLAALRGALGGLR